MADKKLNEVSQLTDFDYALVVKGNDVAKVTKQQLATILGELLGNPKGTKSFSSWSEFTDFVNEMPINNSTFRFQFQCFCWRRILR